MLEFMKLEPGEHGYLQDFPQQCICGSQKGPMVATNLTYRAGFEANEVGHIYLCRMCVTRAARVLGMVKGDEMERLQNAADELATAQQEIRERQEQIDRHVATLGENEQKIQAQAVYIESLQGDKRLLQQQASQVTALAREMATA